MGLELTADELVLLDSLILHLEEQRKYQVERGHHAFSRRHNSPQDWDLIAYKEANKFGNWRVLIEKIRGDHHE